MSGINMFGIYEKQSPLEYSPEDYNEIQEKIALKKRRRKPNFSFIIGTVAKGEAPWDF